MPPTTTTTRRAPMTDAEAEALRRQYRATLKAVDDALHAGARAQYLRTLENVGGLVARLEAEGVRPDGRPEAIRKNADVINRARVSEFERKRDAYITLGHAPLQATELALGYPQTPYKMADASGKAWTHADGKHLERWIEQRNRTLGRARSAAC